METLSTPALTGALSCGIAAHATILAGPEAVAALRQKPLALRGETPSAALFKHADEQTVVGLAAVCRAAAQHGLEKVAFGDWGVLAAPRFIGRLPVAAALERFAAEGAWGISPHVIPHRSLHSLSGMVSQILHIHGPNFGVGGGPEAAAEAILVAGALLVRGNLSGLWLILTGSCPEPLPPQPGVSTPSPTTAVPVCQAVALALVPGSAHCQGPRLRIGMAPGRDGAPFTLEHFIQALNTPGSGRREGWQLNCGGWVEFCPLGSDAESSL